MSSVAGFWTSFSKRIFDAVYPPKCPLCGLLSEMSPCKTCREEFVEYVSPTTEETGLDYRVSLFRYEGRAAQAIRKLKYSRSTSLASAMSSELAEVFGREGLDPDLVVPVPIHWARRCHRGFNQSDLLCEGLPAVSPDALVRVRRTRPQVGLSREQREKNIRGAFRADPSVAGRHVLLVDDVFTSGHTARECARALRAEGATEVGILTFCAGDR